MTDKDSDSVHAIIIAARDGLRKIAGHANGGPLHKLATDVFLALGTALPAFEKPVEAPVVFDFIAAVLDVVYRFRFMANRKKLALTHAGALGSHPCLAARFVLHDTLIDIMEAAIDAAPEGSRVAVEVSRTADRIAADISVPGWEPRLPPPPPSGSNLCLSILRTASGARLVVTAPLAL